MVITIVTGTTAIGMDTMATGIAAAIGADIAAETTAKPLRRA